jgi:hypothetical protein
MPPHRRALVPISSQRLPNHQLTPYQCAKVTGKGECGLSLGQIATDKNLPRSTIQYTLQQDLLRVNGVDLLRSGRPKEMLWVETLGWLRLSGLSLFDLASSFLLVCIYL